MTPITSPGPQMTQMTQTTHSSVKSLVAMALALVLLAASSAFAQSTMIKGKVVDAKDQPMVGVAIVIESMSGGRKLTTKTDKRGEFIQLLTESGQYRITATDEKVGTAQTELRRQPRPDPRNQARAGRGHRRQQRRQGRRAEEGLRRRRDRQPRRQPRRGDRQVPGRPRPVARLLRLPVQHRRRPARQEGRQGGRGGVDEGARTEARLRRGA